MASIMKAVKSIPRELPHGTAKPGFMGTVIDKGERIGFAAAFGYGKGFYGDRFIWKNHGADLWIGGGAWAACLLINLFGGAKAGKLADHLERLGDSGIMSAVGSLAAHAGLEKAGHQVAVLPGKKSGAQKSIVGAVPGAKAGPFLSPQEVLNFAGRR